MSRYCPITQSEQSYLQCHECGNDKKCEYFFCIVAGSRQFNNYDLLCDKLDFLLQNQGGKVIIIHGGCRGADLLAERYAQHRAMSRSHSLPNGTSTGRGPATYGTGKCTSLSLIFPKEALLPSGMENPRVQHTASNWQTSLKII